MTQRGFSLLQKNKFFFVFTVIIILRVVIIHTTDVWIDEAIDIKTALENSFWKLFIGDHMDAAHPPLYFIINKMLTFISKHYIFLRWFSLFVASFGIYFLYLFLQRNKKTRGLWPVFVLICVGFSEVFVPLHILAQSYASVFMLSMLCFFLSFEMLFAEKTSSKGGILLLGVVSFLTFFTDYSGIWPLMTMFSVGVLYYLLGYVKKQNFIRFFKSYFIALILFGLWSPIFFNKIRSIEILESYIANTGYQDANPWLSPLLYWSEHMSGIWILPVFDFIGSDSYETSFIFIGLALLGLLILVFQDRKMGIFGFCLFFIPLSVSHSYSVLSQAPLFHIRNLWIIHLGLAMGFASLFYYGPRFLEKTLAQRLSWTLLIVFCVVYFQRFPSLGFRPQDVIGDFSLTPKMLEYSKHNKALIISDHHFYRLFNFQYLMSLYGPQTEIINHQRFEISEDHINYDIYFMNNFKSRVTKKEKQVSEMAYQKISESLGCKLVDITTDTPPNIFLKYCQMSEK